MSDTSIDPNSIYALIHDMNCADPDKMIIPELAERVRYLKCTKEGRAAVMKTFSQYVDQAVEDAAIETAAKLIA
ncbi:MAG: hypothetical protein IJS39_09690 [Synergistaceae bacterium]|nr:hypothetical protein [Synergistaceae bacterium]